MKRKLALVLTIIMVLSMTACEADNTSQDMGNGENAVAKNGELANGNENLDDVEEQEAGVNGLGLRDVEYHGINAAGTDTDKLAFLQGNYVLVLDFGQGSDIVSGLGINESGDFGTLAGDAKIAFGLQNYSLNEIPSFIMKTEEFMLKTDMESKNEISIPEGGQVVEASDGTYTIAGYPDREDAFEALVTLEGTDRTIAFEIRRCADIETAETFVKYMQKNLKFYRLASSKDISVATDANGNPADLSSYIFFRDVLAKSMADKFGLNVRDHRALMNCTGARHDFNYDGLWQVNLNGATYQLDEMETEPVDFMGYKAYVIPADMIYLVYSQNGEDKCIEIEVGQSGCPETIEGTLELMEKGLFSNYFEE